MIFCRFFNVTRISITYKTLGMVRQLLEGFRYSFLDEAICKFCKLSEGSNEYIRVKSGQDPLTFFFIPYHIYYVWLFFYIHSFSFVSLSVQQAIGEETDHSCQGSCTDHLKKAFEIRPMATVCCIYSNDKMGYRLVKVK